MAYCWGGNTAGLGDSGTTWQSSVPLRVAGGLTFSTLSVGDGHVCGIAVGGAAYCWGYNGSGQLGDGTITSRPTPTPVVESAAFLSLVAGHDGYTCGVTVPGAAYCWGSNYSGQLGDSSTTYTSTPVAVAGGHAFVAVSGGYLHTCGVVPNGTAYCWGFNSSGQLGNNSTILTTVPVAVSMPRPQP